MIHYEVDKTKIVSESSLYRYGYDNYVLSDDNDPRMIEMYIKKLNCELIINIRRTKYYVEIIYTDKTKFDITRLLKEDIKCESRFSNGEGQLELRKSKKLSWKRVDSEKSIVRVYFNKPGIFSSHTININTQVEEDNSFLDVYIKVENMINKLKCRKKERIDIFTFEIYGNIILHGLNKYTLEEVILDRLDNN